MPKCSCGKKSWPISEASKNNSNIIRTFQSDPVVNNDSLIPEANDINSNSIHMFQSDTSPISKANSVSNSNEGDSISNNASPFQE